MRPCCRLNARSTQGVLAYRYGFMRVQGCAWNLRCPCRAVFLPMEGERIVHRRGLSTRNKQRKLVLAEKHRDRGLVALLTKRKK